MTQVMKKDAADLVCVMLEVHIWSGRRHLEREDLVAAHPSLAKLPSQSLATLGAYKICDPDDIKAFQKVKGRAERYLQRVGLPILGAYGVPASKYAEAHDELEKFEREFSDLQGKFLKKFDVAVETWVAAQMVENPDYGHLFNNIPTRDYVERKLAFRFHPYRISAPAGDQSDASVDRKLNGRYTDQVGGLKGELLKEVASEASRLVEEYMFAKDGNGAIKKREYVTPKTLGPLRRAAAKLNDFRFLDASIGPLADLVHEVVSAAGAERIEGAALMKVCALGTLLSDPAKAVEVAGAAMAGVEVDSLLSVINVVQAPPVAVASPERVPEPQGVVELIQIAPPRATDSVDGDLLPLPEIVGGSVSLLL